MKQYNKEIIYRFSCLLTHYLCIFAPEHCFFVASRNLRTLPRTALSAGRRCDFRGKIYNLALVLYSVMSLNLGNSLDICKTNKYQRLRDSVGWTYLYKWVILGPWGIDKGGSRFYCVLRFFLNNPLLSEIVLSP